MSRWFDIDKEGLAGQLEHRPKGFVLLELWQNAVDEDSTAVTIELTAGERRGYSQLVVTDDNPAGFADLADAYTMFAPSKKAGDGSKRGRFNTGEKLVLALCSSAEISSTSGTVVFDVDGTRSRSRRRTESGTIFRAQIKMTAADLLEAIAAVRSVLVPAGVSLMVNGEPVSSREPLRTFAVKALPTVIDHKPTTRGTTIEIHELLPGESPHLYELGIPVVEFDIPFHVSIGQKVPLNADRDNVTPAFAKRLRAEVLNVTVDLLDEAEAAAPWVCGALESDRVTEDAVRAVVGTRFGSKVVTYDPSDTEASRRAVAEDYTVVNGGTFTKAAWENIRRADAARPAGQVLPTPRLHSSPDGIPPIPRERWTPGMTNVARYAEALAEQLLGVPLEVQMSPLIGAFRAAYGPGTLILFVEVLGAGFFDEPDQRALDALLLHEFAHHLEGDHLSDGYHKAICDLGARLRDVTTRVEGVETREPAGVG